MATPAAARKVTIFYEGGSARAPRATIEKLLGPVSLGWARPQTDFFLERRRPYGSRQRTNAAAGEAIMVNFKDGESYTFRITGTHKAFISEVLAKGGESSVASIVSERGTEYGETTQDEGDDGGGIIV
jgi:hypothetical protein